MPRPVQVYSFGDFASRAPNAPPPGDRLDAQFRSHADAIGELHRILEEVRAEGRAARKPVQREAALPSPSLYYGAGGPYAGDDKGATATSADYAQVAIDWAEHLPDTIPGNTLSVTGVSGDHWSSRWWANRSANAFGMLAWWYQGAWPTPGPPSTPLTSTGQPIPVGGMYYNTTTGQMLVWNGAAWVGSTSPGASTGASLYYTAAAAQTVFPLTTPDRNAKTFTFNQSNPEGLAAHVNGLRLESGFDFTVNTVTSTVTFVSGVPAGQQVIFDIFTPTPSAMVSVGLSPPTGPNNGTLWFDLNSGQLYIWMNDGNSFQWVVAVNQSIAGLYLALAGGTMTGPIVLAADPVAALGAATKQYVDSASQSAAIGPNRIINGDMRIDQRNNGANGTAAGYTVDRWQYAVTQLGKFTWGRDYGGFPGPPGFPYYLTFSSLSAYSPAAGDYFIFQQALEADAVSDFQWGTANAQAVILSFWAISGLTGTFSGAIYNYAGTRSYPFTFSIPVATTWTKVSITIPGDTAGTWVMSGNGGSLWLAFNLGGGATYRGPAGAWASSLYFGATGAVNVVATNGAYLSVTAVKFEIGSVATPFPQESLAKRMADCQRYCQAIVMNARFPAAAGSANLSVSVNFQTMRALPTTAVNVASTDNNLASALTIISSANSARFEIISTAAGDTYSLGRGYLLTAEL